MRLYGVAAAICALSLVFLGGCGYLPSEMSATASKKDDAQSRPEPHARISVKRQTVSCNTSAQNFREIPFDNLFRTTGKTRRPFVEAPDLPAQFDVYAYVWGYDNCSQAGTCESGGHYWLIGRGPGREFRTWVVTPQFPRLTIHSVCRDRLKVGQRFRFSFSRGQLVGFSR